MILAYKHTDDVDSTHTPASLFEGDIKLTEEQRTNNMLFGNPEGGTSRAATNVDKIKWPNGVIPYEFDCSVGEYLKCFSSFQKFKSATHAQPQLSPHVRDSGSGFRNLGFGIRSTAQGIRNPTNDWKPESRLH